MTRPRIGSRAREAIRGESGDLLCAKCEPGSRKVEVGTRNLGEAKHLRVEPPRLREVGDVDGDVVDALDGHHTHDSVAGVRGRTSRTSRRTVKKVLANVATPIALRPTRVIVSKSGASAVGGSATGTINASASTS